MPLMTSSLGSGFARGEPAQSPPCARPLRGRAPLGAGSPCEPTRLLEWELGAHSRGGVGRVSRGLHEIHDDAGELLSLVFLQEVAAARDRRVRLALRAGDA